MEEREVIRLVSQYLHERGFKRSLEALEAERWADPAACEAKETLPQELWLYTCMQEEWVWILKGLRFQCLH